MKPAVAYSIAVLVAVLGIISVSALWIMHLRAGPPLEGWVAGPMVVAVPVALVCLLAAWLVERALLGMRVQWTVVRVLAGCLIMAYAVTALFCGPVACFQNGNNRAMGWFIVLGVALAALLHHGVFLRLRRKASDG